jgi:site-specific recombinase XerD
VRTGYKLGPIALRHHRKTVHMFYERALLEKWTLENPCKAVFPPRVPTRETQVLSAREIFDLLKANLDEPIVGKLVLELFGFMRCSSVERVKESDIRWEQRGIIMHGTIRNDVTGQDERGHKSGERKYRQGYRLLLWDWLKHASPKCWTEITAKNYDERKAEAFIRAGVKNSGNVLRHSCASYELAASHDWSHVSHMMQHTSWGMTKRYEGIADEADARLVFAMTPDAVAQTWEQFVGEKTK